MDGKVGGMGVRREGGVRWEGALPIDPDLLTVGFLGNAEPRGSLHQWFTLH